jgi:tryptophan halogenase
MAKKSGNQVVRRVVVAGGGTAGWVTATALVRHLGPLIDITLVESDEIATVGVGESTVPTFRGFHEFMKIDERAFMSSALCTFKLGIEFHDWARIGDRYIHPFGYLGKPVSWMADFHQFWLHAHAKGMGGELGEYCLEWVAGEANRFSHEPGIGYAYHLDAWRYVAFLRGLAEPAGVKRVEGKIQSVERNKESGDIDAVLLENGTRIEGDLFVDCTGFRSLLLGQALEVPFEDWSHWVVTDSAIAMQSTQPNPPRPYTTCYAHEAGWRWQIPLQGREGNGIVYCRDHMSDDEARAKLLADVEGEPLIEPWQLRFKTGMRQQTWAKNCVALGLANGFIEPLESTSIHLMMTAVTRLIQDFPFDGCHDALRRRFNEKSRQEFENIRDFVILHYHVSERDDSEFWKRNRAMDIPDSLKGRIELWREDARAYQLPHELFRVDSWAMVLPGQRVMPEGYHRLAAMMPYDELRAQLSAMRQQIADKVAKMPGHPEYLKGYCPAKLD